MQNRIGLIALLLGVFSISFTLYHFWLEPKTGYILIQDVYNNFNYKIELEKKFLDTKAAKQKILDSLEMRVRVLGNKLSMQSDKDRSSSDIAEFTALREDFLNKKKLTEEDNNKITKQYDSQILNQLNLLIKEYGKYNNYTYIFGNDNNGSLMYAIDSKDISKDVIDYINRKYSKEKSK